MQNTPGNEIQIQLFRKKIIETNQMKKILTFCDLLLIEIEEKPKHRRFLNSSLIMF